MSKERHLTHIPISTTPTTNSSQESLASHTMSDNVSEDRSRSTSQDGSSSKNHSKEPSQLASFTSNIEKDISTDFVLYGTCPYYVDVPKVRRVFVAGPRIFYLSDETAFFSSAESPAATKTASVSRSSTEVAVGPHAFYFIYKGKVGKGKNRTYSTVDGIVAPEHIFGNEKELYILDRFGECYKLSRDQRTRLAYDTTIVRVCLLDDLKRCVLLSDGRVDSKIKFVNKEMFIDVGGKKRVWGLRMKDCCVENTDGLILDQRMLRIYSGYEEIVGEDENFKLCYLKIGPNGNCYSWVTLGMCEGREISAGDGFVIVGKNRSSFCFAPLLLEIRKAIRQIQGFQKFYEFPVVDLDEPSEKLKRSATERIDKTERMKRQTTTAAFDETKPRLSIYIEGFCKVFKTLLSKLLSLNSEVSRLYAVPNKECTFGQILHQFLEETVPLYIPLAKEFAQFHDQALQWYVNENPFRIFELKIPQEVVKTIFDKRPDILNVVFNPFKLLSKLLSTFETLKSSFNYISEETIWNNKNIIFIENLLSRLNEEIRLGNPVTWSSWFGDDTGHMVMSTGSLDDFVNLLKTDLKFDPEFREVFVNTISLFFSPDNVLLKMIPSKVDTLSKSEIVNLLETLKLWLETDPFQFSNLEQANKRLDTFLELGKKDSNGDLKKEIIVLLEMARGMKNEIQFKTPKIETFNFLPKDFCSGFNDHLPFADMMTYTHHCIFNNISVQEYIQFFNSNGQTPNIKHITVCFNWLSETLSKMINDCAISFQTPFFNFIMKTAERFYVTNNFFGLCAIVFAFHKIPDFDYIKKNLSKDTQTSIEKFDSLCSFENNYQGLRKEMERAKPPLVPFAGIMTKEFLVMNEMYASVINKTGQYNFNKLRAIYKLIKKYEAYKNKAVSVPKNAPTELFEKIKKIHGI
ncbi:hypothetical protein EIN_274800 [Entamoeba invadens IP1]|uniref:Guanine nucleotide exchange factor n=1 Tax=Entamoeba invadens IP1 TaxID=370355 RepID=A0A0A1U4S8_ENTIV|nr:hypothetical protein EIN_274800 [Entamoeba invadens IP1]ELP87893.1 hypothetical protein EIN_274800 [Entamoeba invadens IP1]|eukprot:XP_004254664.1 hypothetical protein EIN_274800 [Entamoeba invadens IP1]